MTRLLLFRSKSCAPRNPNRKANMFNPKPPIFDSSEEEYEEEDEEHHWGYVGNSYYGENPVAKFEHGGSQWGQNRNFNRNQFLDVIVTALRKSIVTCGVETDDVMSMDISGPTEVRHVSHVTFDRFDGFLGLPVELETEVPSRVPSASASVFGVSAKSMQCSYDDRGNSVPTILLMMQKRLYSGGGLQAEGIFRLTAENSQERHVRNQLNRGFVPRGIDVHCLAGLIKAWLRELPTGVLDSLTPEQVMNCYSEDECAQLVTLLPPTESALLDWVINLMADVVEHEDHNKMNARNIAVVFAPNMTQMDDPLTALIHAVQVMNLLKTLIMRTLRERKESAAAKARLLSTCSSDDPHSSNSNIRASKEALQSEPEDKFWSFQKKYDPPDKYESVSGVSTPAMYRRGDLEKGEGMLDRLSLRKGVRKICNHPVFQLSKSVKKSVDAETCA